VLETANPRDQVSPTKSADQDSSVTDIQSVLRSAHLVSLTEDSTVTSQSVTRPLDTRPSLSATRLTRTAKDTLLSTSYQSAELSTPDKDQTDASQSALRPGLILEESA
jgi:hypothetical protein